MTLVTCEMREKKAIITADNYCTGGATYIMKRNKIMQFEVGVNKILFAFSGSFVDYPILEEFIRKFRGVKKDINDRNIYEFNAQLNAYFSQSIKDFDMHYILIYNDKVYVQSWGNIVRMKDGDPMVAIGGGSNYGKAIYEYATLNGDDVPYDMMYSVIHQKLDKCISASFNKVEIDLTPVKA